MSVDFKQALIDLLKEFKDAFTWTYAKMLGIGPQLVKRINSISEKEPDK